MVFLRFQETGITSLLPVTHGDAWLLALTAAAVSAEQKLLSSEQAEIRQKKSRMPQCAALLEPLAFNLKIHSVLGLWIEAPLTRVGLVGSTSLEAQWEQSPLAMISQSMGLVSTTLVCMSGCPPSSVNKRALLSWSRLKAFVSSQGMNGPSRAELLQGAQLCQCAEPVA